MTLTSYIFHILPSHFNANKMKTLVAKMLADSLWRLEIATEDEIMLIKSLLPEIDEANSVKAISCSLFEIRERLKSHYNVTCLEMAQDLESYKTMLREARKSPKTIKSYSDRLRNFWLSYRGDWRRISIADFVTYSKRSGIDGPTIKNIWLSVSTYYVNLNQFEWSTIPDDVYQKTMRRQAILLLTREEVAKISDATPNEQKRALLWLMYAAGLRMEEVACLRLSDLIPSDNISYPKIRIHNGHVRYVALREDTWIKLNVHKKNIEKIYFDYYGKIPDSALLFPGITLSVPVSNTYIHQTFSRALLNSGLNLSQVTLSTLRYSFCAALIRAGLPNDTIRELMGLITNELIIRIRKQLSNDMTGV